MFDKVFDDASPNEIGVNKNPEICSRIVAKYISSDENLSKIASSLYLEKGFSRLLLHLSILSKPDVFKLFETFINETSPQDGAFVIFNFLCPSVFPKTLQLSKDQSSETIFTNLTKLLEQKTSNEQICSSKKEKFISEMNLVILRHKAAARIETLEIKIGKDTIFLLLLVMYLKFSF